MPVYAGTSGATTDRGYTAYVATPKYLSEFDRHLLFNAEAIVAGQASEPVCLKPGYTAGQVVSVEILFSAAPGAFEIDMQDADTEADAWYQNIVGGQISAVNAITFVARAEITVKGKFLRALVKTLTNAVNVTVRVTR